MSGIDHENRRITFDTDKERVAYIKRVGPIPLDYTINYTEKRWWRIDDDRTGEVIVIPAATSSDALDKFLECCAENTRIQEADAADMENWGPGSGSGWYQE